MEERKIKLDWSHPMPSSGGGRAHSPVAKHGWIRCRAKKTDFMTADFAETKIHQAWRSK